MKKIELEVISMKIKQQNQIKEILIEEFGVDKGNSLFEKQLLTNLSKTQRTSQKIR